MKEAKLIIATGENSDIYYATEGLEMYDEFV